MSTRPLCWDDRISVLSSVDSNLSGLSNHSKWSYSLEDNLTGAHIGCSTMTVCPDHMYKVRQIKQSR